MGVIAVGFFLPFGIAGKWIFLRVMGGWGDGERRRGC